MEHEEQVFKPKVATVLFLRRTRNNLVRRMDGLPGVYRMGSKNGWRPGLTIERIDVNKGYSPENCTIIPYALQAQNKTTNIRIKIMGKKNVCLSGAEYLISRSKEHGKIPHVWVSRCRNHFLWRGFEEAVGIIDIESFLFSQIAGALRASYEGIFVSGEYVDSPAKFPAVTIVESDNSVLQKWER